MFLKFWAVTGIIMNLFLLNSYLRTFARQPIFNLEGHQTSNLSLFLVISNALDELNKLF